LYILYGSSTAVAPNPPAGKDLNIIFVTKLERLMGLRIGKRKRIPIKIKVIA
jgi:hypothetical protein